MKLLFLCSILVTFHVIVAILRPQAGATNRLERDGEIIGNDDHQMTEITHDLAPADPTSHQGAERYSTLNNGEGQRLPGENGGGSGWRNIESEYHSHNDVPRDNTLNLLNGSGKRPRVSTQESHRIDVHVQSDHPTNVDIPMSSRNYTPKGDHLTAQDREGMKNWKGQISNTYHSFSIFL
ncbi:hypothetical protein PCASD_05187 [Puccinia coronata f. sp. avenae]|uniref:Uncharacterized protein n=1 Tax=Puccinia coronata f. sp. avenae TaxID=200324 RepID=A0A2N5TH03_9BASI|nr:hypothetical protein PCASD_05187 [Puccinia coronata f. sp. avenae]